MNDNFSRGQIKLMAECSTKNTSYLFEKKKLPAIYVLNVLSIKDFQIHHDIVH